MTPSNAINSLRHLSGADSGAHTKKNINTRNIFFDPKPDFYREPQETLERKKLR